MKEKVYISINNNKVAIKDSESKIIGYRISRFKKLKSIKLKLKELK